MRKTRTNDSEFLSPQYLRLAKELKETREKLEKVQTQLDNADKRNVQMMSKYTKEENLRSMNTSKLALPYPEQAELMKSQIETRFFSVTDGLDPAIVEILNQKILQIK